MIRSAGSDGVVAEPPQLWQEQWFGHEELLRLHRADEHAAVYIDRDVRPADIDWMARYVSDVWRYCKDTYGGDFGPDQRVYAIFHQGRHGGGHAVGHSDPVKGYRNVSDVGAGPWHPHPGVRDITTHEIGHLVEGENHGVSGSPAFPVWGDSKWAEFFLYDIYTAFGLPDAHDVRSVWMRGSDDFPRPGSHWFRDWFFPMWSDVSGPGTMIEFFRLLAAHFPRDPSGGRYARSMTWGEYLHFSSAAVGGDLRRRATRAFGVPNPWSGSLVLPDAWIEQLERARSDFPQLRY